MLFLNSNQHNPFKLLQELKNQLDKSRMVNSYQSNSSCNDWYYIVVEVPQFQC